MRGTKRLATPWDDHLLRFNNKLKDAIAVTADAYTERLAEVRQRFSSKLSARLQTVEAALPHLAGNGPDVVEAVSSAHHQIHLLCGLAPTVGFPRTGQAARKIERLLIDPVRNKCGLSDRDVEQLKSELDALRAVAQAEMSSTN